MKILVVAAVVVFSVNNALAQSAFRIGFAGMAQSTWLLNGDDSDNPYMSNQLTINPAFSLKFSVNITQRSAFATGITYSKQGQLYESGEDIFTSEREVKHDYMKIPFMYHYNSDIDNTVRFIFGIGPQLAIRTSTDVEFNGGNNALQYDELYSTVDVQVAFLAGAAYSIIKELELTVAFRGDYGFLNVEDQESEIYEDLYGIASSRPNTNNLTGGLEIGLNYLIR